MLEDNETFRIDSEHFKKHYFNIYNFLNNKFAKKLEEFSPLVTGGATPLGADYLEGDIPFLRVQNIMPNYLNTQDLVYLTKKQDAEITRSKLKTEDVLLTITGVSYGKSCVVPVEFEGANINQHSVRIRLTNNQINPYFLSTLLNSKYGKSQSDKYIVGVTRPALDYTSIRKLKIPSLSVDFQKFVEFVIKSSINCTRKSQELYQQAERVLLEELGLVGFKPSTQGVSIKTFAQSFGTTGRLDAEYYQPKYEALEKALNTFPTTTLSQLVNYPIASGITPKAGGDDYTDSSEGIPFVRAVDLVDGIVSLDKVNYVKPHIHKQTLKRTQLKCNDVLFSIAGTVGRTALYNQTVEANINQAVAILRFDESVVQHFYLITFFNSFIGKLLVEKFSRQGLQTNLNLEEVGNLYLPVLEKPIQDKISQLVRQGLALKTQSEALLEIAKRGVELAIETTEAQAQSWMQSQLEAQTP